MSIMTEMLENQIDVLTAQRNKLLAALKNLMRIYTEPYEGDGSVSNPGWGQSRPGQYADEARAVVASIDVTARSIIAAIERNKPCGK